MPEVPNYAQQAAQEVQRLNAAADEFLRASASADALRAFIATFDGDDEPRAVYAREVLAAEVARLDRIAATAARMAQKAARAKVNASVAAAVLGQKESRKKADRPSTLARDFLYAAYPPPPWAVSPVG